MGSLTRPVTIPGDNRCFLVPGGSAARQWRTGIVRIRYFPDPPGDGVARQTVSIIERFDEWHNASVGVDY